MAGLLVVCRLHAREVLFRRCLMDAQLRFFMKFLPLLGLCVCMCPPAP